VVIECFRTWGCACRGQHGTPYDYLALFAQLGRLDQAFPEVPRAGLPWFPRSIGDAAGKVSVVTSIEYIACILGEDLVNLQGLRGRDALHGSSYPRPRLCSLRGGGPPS